MNLGKVYLIPCVLDEKGVDAIPAYILVAVQDCQVIFAENERTARRYLKTLQKEIVIDDFEWHTIHKAEEQVVAVFAQQLKQGKNVAIISEAGCPGIADPGQLLIAKAQELNATVKPLVGPSSILLALMASGMNGQRFQFVGYLPIDVQQRQKAIKELAEESKKKNCTQLFIETPYRNNQLFETLIKTCQPNTKLGVAVDLTGETEWVKTKTVGEWKKEIPNLHKRQAIFLLLAE